MRLPLYQVDAFADRLFTGNPAAVVPLPEWLPDTVMQAIAAENNLSETAFFVPHGDDWSLRWFTPEEEIDLCGHATLAAAHVILEHLHPSLGRVEFETREAGRLSVTRDGDLLTLDFPSLPPHPCPPPPGLIPALGDIPPREVLAARYLLIVYEHPEQILALRPDMTRLADLCEGVIVTAPGGSGEWGTADFVSRFFTPRLGIPEDPVTGSAHCTLAPYWAARLGRDRLLARQLSRRGGTLHCALKGGRVLIGGRAVLYLRGDIDI